MWAFRRRLNIVLLILAIIICFGIIPYYISHIEPPSCFDTKQNQEEEGVDCGGPCAIICKGKAQELNILWQKLSLVRPGVYEAAFFVENQNVSVGASEVPYTVRVYGGEGKVLAERKGKTYAGSNENLLIYEGNISLGSSIPDRTEITFDPFTWITTQKKEQLFSVLDKTLTQFETKPRLSANIRNDSPFTQENIEVGTVISDDESKVVGYGKTIIDRLLPGESRMATFTWTSPFVYQASVEACDRPIDVLLAFDRSGSMESDGKNPPEPLTTAINAASTFVGKLRVGDQAGLVSFATTASNPIDRTLTRDKEKVKQSVVAIAIGKDGTQYTNIGDALLRSLEELKSRRQQSNGNKAIILLTDGDPTYPEHPEDKQYPFRYAEDAANKIKEEGISLYTIGLGRLVKADFLSSLSTKPEHYFVAESARDLGGVYEAISKVLCKKAPSVVEVFPRVNNVLR